MTLNEIISQQGAPIYYTPINVWADIYQPNPMDAIANPPIEEIRGNHGEISHK